MLFPLHLLFPKWCGFNITNCFRPLEFHSSFQDVFSFLSFSSTLKNSISCSFYAAFLLLSLFPFHILWVFHDVLDILLKKSHRNHQRRKENIQGFPHHPKTFKLSPTSSLSQFNLFTKSNPKCPCFILGTETEEGMERKTKEKIKKTSLSKGRSWNTFKRWRMNEEKNEWKKGH